MRNTFKNVALALPMAAAMMVAAPAMAQSRLGVAVADVEAAVANSNAYTVARGQMNTTYKTQIDQFNSRKTALEADLKAKQDALEAAAKAAGANPAPAVRTQLQTQYGALQTAQQSAQAELQRIGQPVAIAQAYVEEQIAAKLNDALKNAMTAAKVDLVLKPDSAVSFQPSVDITAQVKAQLDTLVPSASIVPPAGWRPGGQQQGAAPAAAAPAAPAAKPTGPLIPMSADDTTAPDGTTAIGPLDIRRIMAALPHRYPMLLVDRVVSIIPNQSIHAVKAVSINEPFFQGHFPGRPIMPGVLIVEAMAQAAGILAFESKGLVGSGKLVYFMGIEEAKFRAPVEPGCLLDFHISITKARGAISKFAGRALIDGKLHAEASFTAMVADAPKD